MEHKVEHSVIKIMSYVSHKQVEQVETMQGKSSECLESLFTDYICWFIDFVTEGK